MWSSFLSIYLRMPWMLWQIMVTSVYYLLFCFLDYYITLKFIILNYFFLFKLLNFSWTSTIFFGFFIIFLVAYIGGNKVGYLFKFFFCFCFYNFTYYHKVDRWGRLVGGKFPMLIFHYNTQLDTSGCSYIFFLFIF